VKYLYIAANEPFSDRIGPFDPVGKLPRPEIDQLASALREKRQHKLAPPLSKHASAARL
jgi:hypothetical protein